MEMIKEGPQQIGLSAQSANLRVAASGGDRLRDIRFLLKTHYTGSRALIVGINQYAAASPLSYAVSDAREVERVLVETLSFPKENITCLIDSEATKDRILRAFMRYTAQDIEPDERILVFFAGHGYTRTGIRGEVGYLVPSDADLSDLSTLIRWDDLTRNADLVRAKHMLFVMDACYGGLALTRGLHPGSARFLKDMMLRYSRQVLAAGKADEVVADSGGPLPNHSVFTGHLIEGIRGKAASADGVLTASGLMSYVYSKVANDKNSRQTPHYGFFDGDGDFILYAPVLAELRNSAEKDLDNLVVVPFVEEARPAEGREGKIQKVKMLLADNSSAIELHDFLVSEVQRFLSATSEDNFKAQGSFSKQELLERIAKYEEVVGDLSLLTACIAYWARSEHNPMLQKILSRATDRLEVQNGLTVWINLRWYPLIVQLYSAGIAAVEGKRYDSLATIFYTKVGSPNHRDREELFVEAVAAGILELTRMEVFKQMPEYERHYTPMSDYLFKVLQPRLDDALFMGMSYERSFDEFEVLFALVVADLRMQRAEGEWGPIGRFGWKRSGLSNAPLARIVSEAQAMGNDWGPLKASLFGGSIDRFNKVADVFQRLVGRLGWW